MNRSYFHLHLVSDSTGETLLAVSRAVAAQYEGISAIEHVYPLVRSAAQHTLNADYFKRIDAMNYTLAHDDGQTGVDLDGADVILVGVSRTSKTPTAIYLANRGIKTANIPLVPGMPLPPALTDIRRPLVVGLVASPDRIVQIRQNRLLSLNANDDSSYVDKQAVAAEIAESRKLCARYGWPVIDVTRRSIEETAAAIMELLGAHRLKFVDI